MVCGVSTGHRPRTRHLDLLTYGDTPHRKLTDNCMDLEHNGFFSLVIDDEENLVVLWIEYFPLRLSSQNRK